MPKISQDTVIYDGGWSNALKQAPENVVLCGFGNKQNIKIVRLAKYCLLVDLMAYDKLISGVG